MLKKAFTLLEMLVVIGIIGVLIGVGTIAYSTAQRKARDAKRKQDLKNFQKAMEQCYAINNYNYPIITGNNTTSISTNCPENSLNITITDPTNRRYSVNSNSSGYSVSISLETEPPFTINNQQ